MTEAIFKERLQAIIDWADIALKNRAEFDSHGVRNLDGPVFDAAREALAKDSPVSRTGWENEEKLTVEQAWTILCETPDITSPEEYPDHALITMEQLGSFMARARPELYDADEFMADGEIPMTAAEDTLAWLLVEKIGVVDDVGYSPKQARDIIVAAIDDAGKQLVEGGDLLLKAEAVISEMTELCRAAKDVIASASDTYKKRNGHRSSFEDDSGEKCWIVPFDAFEGLRSAVAALSTTAAEAKP